MEQENGWVKLFHHKWCFRGHSTALKKCFTCIQGFNVYNKENL